MDIADANSKMDSHSANVHNAALLLVIGEPHSDEHKSLILAEVTKGFRCWNGEGFDINDELAQIANRADLGEEGPNAQSPYGTQLKEGERIIRHRSDDLCCEILVNPQTQTLNLAVKNFLSTPTKYKHLIYAGHAFQGTGAWILQDDTYTFSNFAHAFKDQDVDNAVKQQEGCALTIYTVPEGSWTDGHITKNDFSKLLKVKLNPEEKLESIHGVLQFTAYVGNFVKVRQLNELLQSTDVVGNIRFSRPTLYIFPACQGDSALFGISGFNLLVNGGFSRKACFWDFTRHLDRIDAALMTHLGTDNLYGLSAVLQRKATENVHPEIGFMYLNVSDKLKAIQNGGEVNKEDGSLLVNLADEGNKLVECAKQLGQFPHPCSRSQSGQTVDPINLYHKVGIGSLDMYILNPITDSKELKEFYQQWNQRVAQFGIQQHVPLPNTLSVCALLVWRPSNPNDNITRIFFPGNAPQHKIMEGLEKLKNLDILKHAQCSKASLGVKPTASKKPLLGSKPPTARSKVSPVQTPKQELPKKEIQKPEAKVAAKPRPASAPKTKKEVTNKKTSKENEKTDKTKSSTSSSPSKASTKSATPSTPKSIVSPVQEPAEPVPTQEPEPTAAPDVTEPPKPEPAPTGGEADLLGLDSSVDPPHLVDVMAPAVPKQDDLQPVISDSPAPLPEPEQTVPPGALGKEQLLELGVYDEDQDIEEHLNAQPEKVPDMFGGMAESMHEDLQPVQQPMSDLMTTSMHESMYDDRGQFGEQPQPHNGLVLTPDDEDSEEIEPQALPEPMAYAPAGYSQEPDIIPSMPMKDTIVPEPETPVLSEPDLLPVKPEHEEIDEQSTAKIEDELSGATDMYDKHSDDKEIESPDEVSKLPLDKDLAAETSEAEKHLSEDEGFEQDHFKEEEVEEKDVTEESEKMTPSPVCEEQKAKTVEVESEMEIPESDLAASKTYEEEKIAPQSEPVVAPVSENEMKGVEIEDAKEETVQAKEEEIKEAKEETAQIKEEEIEVSKEETLQAKEEEKEDVKEEAVLAKEEEIEDVKVETVQAKEEEIEAVKEETVQTKEEEIGDLKEKTDQVKEEATECIKEESEHVPFMSDNVEDKLTVGEMDDLKKADSFESPYLSPVLDSDRDVAQTDTNIEEDYRQIQEQPSEPVDESIKMQTERPVDLLEQETLEEDQEVSTEQRESPDIMLEQEQDAEEEFESQSHDLSESPEPDQVERPKSPEPEDIENIAQKEEEFSHEGTPDSIEEQSEDKEIIGDDSYIDDSLKEQSSGVDADEEKENVEPAVEPATEEPIETVSRDSLEREPIPVPADFQDDQRDSVERDDDEEEEEDDEDEEESSEEEESQSQSTSYEEEEASDQKCLIQDSVSEDSKVKVSESRDTEEEMGAAGRVDSLGVESQPSDSLLTPESEGMEHSYHQMAEQDDVDSFEGVDHVSSVPAAPHDFGHPHAEPFDVAGHPGFNQFMGMDNQPMQPQHENPFDDSSDDEQAHGGPAGFDPLAEWGQPMGLPSPSPPDSKTSGATTDKKSPKDKGAKPTELKKPDAKKTPSTASKAKPSTQATKAPKPSNGVPERSKRLSGIGTSNPSRLSTGGVTNSLNTSKLSTEKKTAATKGRPASAPVKDKPDVKTNETKRPATATAKTSAGSAVKMPPLPPFTPFYVDLTYIPNHGNPQYSDVEFFKRVRARYYVLSALSPDPQILDALLEAKKTWEDKEIGVTIIPTYDNETLRHWMGLHKELLSDMKVEVAPSASRCTIQLQDHETSSSAYRLEF